MGLDWDLVWRLITALAWAVASLTSMRFGSIIRSLHPRAFRLSGTFGVAGASSLVLLATHGGDIWFDITRLMAIGFYLFLTIGLWRTGTNAEKLYRFERDLTNGSN